MTTEERKEILVAIYHKALGLVDLLFLLSDKEPVQS